MTTRKTLALFQDDRSKAAISCGDGIVEALSPHHNIKIFKKEQCTEETFKDVDMLVFPGGVGDADDYFRMFPRKKANTVADFVANGGAYLGICVGAYWAGPDYFDILKGAEPVQYIKRPTADIMRSCNIAAQCVWNGEEEKIFFRDGCTFVGDLSDSEIVSTYYNKEPMCIKQGKIGVMGACLDSQKWWYDNKTIKQHWHQGRHHRLLLDFVNQLTK
jgi:glutamine amidotransferase-like uncharacterized protein